MGSAGVITKAAGTRDVPSYVQALLNSLPPIYQKDINNNTVINRLYTALATELVKADVVLQSVGNNNYLSIQVTDELIIRGSGPLDRLLHENAFELDNIRFTSSTAQILQNVVLQVGANVVQLYFVPSSIDISIFDANSTALVPLNFPTSFDSATNTLTIQAPVAGPYIIGYNDTGDVVRLSENITVPVGIFQLGWDEGAFDDLGWDE